MLLMYGQCYHVIRMQLLRPSWATSDINLVRRRNRQDRTSCYKERLNFETPCIVRGESNFHQNVVDSNLPGTSITGQDTFNICNNCVFHGNNNLNSIDFVLTFILTFHFRHANLEKVNCTSLFRYANFYYSTQNACRSFHIDPKWIFFLF
jgi:hypothetical protein